MWKNYPEYKNLNRDLKLPQGYEAHHWSYKRENIRSVFVLPIKKHKKVHTYLEFIENERCFSYKGALLDTMEKHEQFLKEINVI